MEIISAIIGILPYVVILLVLLGGAIAFFKGEKTSLKDWLLYACTLAEKELGSKTGQLKLKYVWSMACEQFKFLTTFLSFEKFSEMVDDCLIDFRHLIETNDNIAEYVRTDKKINSKGDE